MRRAMQALLIGGALLSAATACGTATNPPPGTTPGGSAAAAPASAPAGDSAADTATRSSCEALGQVYNTNMAPLAEALTRLTAAKDRTTATKQAQDSLRSFATAVQSATSASADTQLRADGKKAADQLQAKAKDAATFATVKTTADVNTLLGPTLKTWLAPVQKHCS